MSQQATSATPFLTFLTIIWGRECVHSCVLRHGSNECDSLLHLHIRNHPLQARAHLIWTVQTVTSDRACVEPCLTIIFNERLITSTKNFSEAYSPELSRAGNSHNSFKKTP